MACGWASLFWASRRPVTDGSLLLIHVATNQGYPNKGFLLVINVLLTKKSYKRPFFIFNALVEKSPRSKCPPKEVKGIEEDDLGGTINGLII